MALFTLFKLSNSGFYTTSPHFSTKYTLSGNAIKQELSLQQLPAYSVLSHFRSLFIRENRAFFFTALRVARLSASASAENITVSSSPASESAASAAAASSEDVNQKNNQQNYDSDDHNRNFDHYACHSIGFFQQVARQNAPVIDGSLTV